MALSQTLTLSHGREFGGSNPGIRLDDSADPVEMDSGFFTVPEAGTEVAGAFIKATFRTTTAWVHVNKDLWLANVDGTPTGARTDIGVDLYSPTTDKWCRLAFATYTAAASRSDGLAQITFDTTTGVPTNIAGKTYQSLRDWTAAVEAELPHDVDITFTSASSEAYSPPAPPTPPRPPAEPGIVLAGKQIESVYLGSTKVAAVYLGDKKIFGSESPQPVMDTPVLVSATSAADGAKTTFVWTWTPHPDKDFLRWQIQGSNSNPIPSYATITGLDNTLVTADIRKVTVSVVSSYSHIRVRYTDGTASEWSNTVQRQSE